MSLKILRNRSVGLKVTLAPLFAMACLIIVGGLGYYANLTLSGQLKSLAEEHFPRAEKAAAMYQKLAELNAKVNKSLAWEGAGFKAETIASLDRSIDDDLREYAAGLNTMASSGDAGDVLALQLLQKQFATFDKTVRDAIDIKSGMVANAASAMTAIESTYTQMQSGFSKILRAEGDRTAAAAESGRALRDRNSTMVVGAILVGASFCLVMTVLTARSIVVPLRAAARQAQSMSTGDFVTAQGEHSKDATGDVLRSLQEVSAGVGTMLAQVRAAAEAVQSASTEIASGNQDLSSRTESTASSLQQTSASIHQLSSAVGETARSAEAADLLAAQARSVALDGNKVVTEVVGAMQDINRQAQRIGEITAAIEGIAFQTNILALNAAVEAARAGDQGRGFAVVAQEVRALARRSSEAAREIGSLIEATVSQVAAGSEKAGVAGTTMGRLVEAVGAVSETVANIAKAATQQADSLRQVNAAVADMDKSTQQNAALVEEASAASESLRHQAQGLVEAIGSFRTA